MTKSETKKNLEEIKEMSAEEIADNPAFIKKTAESALCLIREWEGIKTKYIKTARRNGAFNKEWE